MNKIRNDIYWFKHNHDIVYLDSAATSLKPYSVISNIKEYIEYDCTNPHNSDSIFAYKAHAVIDQTRKLLANYLNCEAKNVVFTPSATFSLNMIADSLNDFLVEGDQIVLTNAEHASNLLPWFNIRDKKNVEIKFANTVIKDTNPSEHDILNHISNKTKIVSFANGTNLLGTSIDAVELARLIKQKNPNTIVIVDATQYLASHKMDLKDSNIDFVVGSAHKMMGPTGIGFMYINNTLFDKLKPHVVGGGMNHVIRKEYYTLMDGPAKFEAGTPNVAGIYGWNAALKYYQEIDLDNSRKQIYQLKKYLDDQLKQIKNVTVHNPDINSFITIFSYDGVFSQDLASYLGTKGIIVRSGLSCAKLADEIIDIPHVIRVSMHFYTTKQDIDKLIDVMKNYQKGDELNAIL